MYHIKFHSDLPPKDNGRAIVVILGDETRPGKGYFYIKEAPLENELRDEIAEFIAYAWAHPDEVFYVRDMFGPAPRAAMFFALAPYRNCYFPESYRPYIGDARAYIEEYHG